MTRVVCRIQAHPARAHLWPDLLEAVKPLSTDICVHSSDPPSPWDGYKIALRSLIDDPSKPTHGVVIQEDTIVCKNFAAAVEEIAKAKSDPVCLFLSWLPNPIVKDAREALIKRESYIRARPAKFIPAVAILWPVESAERFLEWAESGVRLPGYPDQVRSDDACLGEWVRRKKETIWLTCPSLVEHPDNVDSVKGRNNAAWGKDKGRVALSFIGERDPMELDWT